MTTAEMKLANQPPAPIARRPIWPLAVLAAMLAVALLAVAWFDPRQTAIPLCGLHWLTGLHCPGCGATRATHELLHGRWLAALHNNAVWVLSLPLLAYAAASEARFWLVGRPLPGDPLRRPWLLAAGAAVAVAFFVLRNLPWMPFLLLAPPG